MARLLLVDDDTDQLELRRMVLEAAGHEVQAAETTVHAQRAFSDFTPDFVLMDLRLPSLEDGLSLIRSLRTLSGDVRIFVMSGWMPPPTGAPELELADELLPKPYPSSRLLALIAAYSGATDARAST